MTAPMQTRTDQIRAGKVREGPRHHFRHHLARRRAMPRRHHDSRREARGRRDARRHGRRRHRGRLSDRLRRRFRRGQRDRQALQECGDLRARPRRLQGHRPLRRSDPAGQAAAHPHLPLHLAGAHEIQAAEGAAPGLRDGDRAGDARAQPDRRRRMVERGRHPHRARFPLPLRRGRDQGRRHHHQHSRHRRLYGAGGIFRAHQDGARAGAEFRQGALLRPLPQRSRHGGGEFAGRRAAPARGRSNAPSTASASAPATPRSRKW